MNIIKILDVLVITTLLSRYIMTIVQLHYKWFLLTPGIDDLIMCCMIIYLFSRTIINLGKNAMRFSVLFYFALQNKIDMNLYIRF